MNSFNSLLASAYRDINAGFRDVVRYSPETDPNKYQPYLGRTWERFGPDSPVYGVNVEIPIEGAPNITIDHVDPPLDDDRPTMTGHTTYYNWPTDEQLDAMADEGSLIFLLPAVLRTRFNPYSQVTGFCTIEELPYVLLAMTKTVEAIRS